MRSRGLNLAKAGLVSALFAIGSLLASAQVVGGIDLGAAGPDSWGVLALGGSGAPGFGSRGTSVQFAGAPPHGGISGGTANLGIAGTGRLQASSVTIDGAYFKGSITATDSISNTTIAGGIQMGSEVDSTLASAASAASAGLAAARALSCNMGALCNTALTSSLTIDPVNDGGQNVLIVSSIRLGNRANITLAGSAGTNWVVIVTGGLTLNSASISLASELTPPNNLIVVNGDVSTSGGLNNESSIDGVLIVPTGTVHFSPGMINGEVITGGNQVAFASGATVNTPQPVLE
jgi:hypothetical protein